MKKLFKNIALFLLPLLLLLYFLPIDKKLQYSGLTGDCHRHAFWIHDRIFWNTNDVDVAILGSSHTMNGVNDEILTLESNNQTITNFGYCRLGLNHRYVLLKEILKKKKIKHLIIEVRERESKYSHPIFPFVASSKDVLTAPPILNKAYFSDISKHFTYKIEITQEKLYHVSERYGIKDSDYGFHTTADTALSQVLEKAKQKKKIPNPSKLDRFFQSWYYNIYLKKINRICKKKDIKLSFLYMPSFGTPQTKPINFDELSTYGNVIIPPQHILDNKNYWYDPDHFNRAGADEFSKWLIKKL
jgi:hypothetical protein